MHEQHDALFGGIEIKTSCFENIEIMRRGPGCETFKTLKNMIHTWLIFYIVGCYLCERLHCSFHPW